jgi:hypothetical protein
LPAHHEQSYVARLDCGVRPTIRSGLKAVNCGSSDSLGDEQAKAESEEQVLKALDDAAGRLRAKLGEI